MINSKRRTKAVVAKSSKCTFNPNTVTHGTGGPQQGEES